MNELENEKLLRFQKIYKVDLTKYKIKEELAEILAPENELKIYLSKIEKFKKRNIKYIEKEKIKFDFFIFKKIIENLNRIKKIWLWITININYETLYYIYKNKKTFYKFRNMLKKIKKAIWKDVILELSEIWCKNKSITSNNIEYLKYYYNISNWLVVYAIDDIIPNKKLDKYNIHYLPEILPIILKNKMYKYIKIDIKWTKFYLNNLKKLQQLLDVLEKYKDMKNIIFEWLENYEEIYKLLEWIKKYKNIWFNLQWFALHKPEILK